MERHPDETERPLDELSGTLRQAVEAVRNQEVPNPTLQVALRKAGNAPRESTSRRLMFLVAACFVAAFGVSLWALHQEGQRQVAILIDHSRSSLAADHFDDTAQLHAAVDAFTSDPHAPDGTRHRFGLVPTEPKAGDQPYRGTQPYYEHGYVPRPAPNVGRPVPDASLATSPSAQPANPGLPPPPPPPSAPPSSPPPPPGDPKEPGKKEGSVELLAKLSLVVRDQKLVRRAEEAATGKLNKGEVDEFRREVDARLKGGDVDEKEAKALEALKDRLDQESQSSADQFEKFIPNPFLRARDNPLSTFSSDVDTASYSLVRRFLMDENRLPPPDAVRIEEMINYFRYAYPQPRGEHPISITPEVSACPWNKDHRLVRIAVQARDVDPENLPPRNLVFLVDVSGSMNAPDRLPLVQQSLGFLIDQLTAKDRVAIVVYAGNVGTVLQSTPGTEKALIRRAVESLSAGGSTNGAGGIMAAYEEAHRNFIPGGVNRVILATDGDFNVGITSQGDLVRMIEEKRDKGIFLTALGYGMGNLKDSTIMKLADHGHGHYAYIDSAAEAKKVFVDDGMSLVTLAKDVKIQVEFNPKTVEAYKLIGYEKRLMRAQDFNDDTKLAGVMGCGHRVTVLYEIVPAGKKAEVPAVDDLRYQQASRLTKEADSGELLTVKLRYKDPLANKSQLLLAPVADKGEAFDKASADCRFAAAVAAFAILLRDNPKDAGINLAGVAELAESALGQDPAGRRKEFVELVKLAEKLSKK